MRNHVSYFSFFLVFFICLAFINADDDNEIDDSSLKLQPEYDRINITEYLLNERRLKLQVKCLLFDGPCDSIGNWLKPRVKAALLGKCLKCTELQTSYMLTWMTVLTEYFPELHRAAVAKYISGQGIAISSEDQALIQKINSAAGWADFVTRLKTVVQDMQDGKFKTTRQL